MKKISKANRFFPLLVGIVLVATSWCYAKTLNEKITTPDHEYDIHYYNRDSTETNWYTSDSDAQSIADHFDPETGTGIHDAQDNLSFREPAGYRRDVKLVEQWAPGVSGSANWTRIRLPVALLNSLGHGGAGGLCARGASHFPV